jgi:hypothetical protein
VELQSRVGEMQKLGLGLASFSYDAPEVIRTFTAERNIEFPLMSDQGGAVVTQYGIINRTFEPGHNNFGIPHPGTFLVDPQGRVLARFFEDEFRYRNTIASIALKIDKPIDGMGEPVSHSVENLDVTAFLSDATVAPGSRFSIVLDITPKAGAQIVAPGQHSYRAIALRLEASENLRTYAATYPSSAEVQLAPTNEQVSVYQQPFRLAQDVAIVVNDEMREVAQQPDASFTLKGVLEYQSCSGGSCGPAQQVPVEWTVNLRPLG